MPEANPARAAPALDRGRRKDLGAYYTALPVVEFLVDWGLDASPGVVMDPSSGDGRFLIAAAQRGSAALIGCDLDPDALRAAGQALADAEPPVRWHAGDFFQVTPAQTGPVDLVVGNPPFIRYQQFSGESRTRALASALKAGARLSRLAASWAPFLLHALQFLRPGGAMGMVVPAELAQTTYGVETLRALCASFARVRLITFRHNWFDDAQQETFLLLAEGRGGRCSAAELIPLGRIDELASLRDTEPADIGFRFGADSGSSIGLAFVEPDCRDLVRRLSARPDVVPLNAFGEVVNGYVSGANNFFHCTAAEGKQRRLPPDWLLPVARNSRSLKGLGFDADDIATAERGGAAHHLILPRDDDLFSADHAALDGFKRDGERLGIPLRYKCRVRNPWWRVPGLVRAELLLPYMIGAEPHVAVNRCYALYPNSLHGLRLRNPALADRIALGLLSSLSLLSMELEGRSYGGGVLKLEPTEMQRVRLVLPTAGEAELHESFDDADRLIRQGDFRAAVAVADELVLSRQLHMAPTDIERIQVGRAALVQRRLTRSRRS
jgi:predicted RNA methylase